MGGVKRILTCCGSTLLGGALACASTSSSEIYEYGASPGPMRISARAERGWAQDQLVIAVNEVDVAEGPFGPDQAAGTVLHGMWEETPIEARCGHRWRPGIHISYRCAVYVAGDGPIQLDF